MESELLIMHIDMNAFFASVEQVSNPFLRGKPVGVCGKPKTRSVVAAASYEAKAFGVESGMSIYEARKLCPNIVLVRANCTKYADISIRILNIFKDFTPLVEVYSIDEAFLDVTGSLRRWKEPEAMAREIKKRLREELSLRCSIGIASNKLLAKLASGMQKPDGLVRLRQEEVPQVLEDLPVQKLWGIGPRLAQRLGEMGITTCGQLAQMPLSRLKRRFGVLGENLHHMARGEDSSPVAPYSHDDDYKSMGHCLTLEKDTRDMREIERVLLHLSEQVGRRLRREGYSGRTVSLTLREADFFTYSKQKALKGYIHDGYKLYLHARSILHGFNLKGKAIRMIGVSLSSLIKGQEQLSLLEEERRDEALLFAMDIVNDRYGEFTLKRASLVEYKPPKRFISRGWRPRGDQRGWQMR